MREVIIGPDGHHVVVELEPEPWPALVGLPVAATLNAVLGVWTLEQAAAIAGLPAEALVAEAQAWAVASQP